MPARPDSPTPSPTPSLTSSPVGAIDSERHPIAEAAYAKRCRAVLEADGALVLDQFFTSEAIGRVVDEFDGREAEAFYADSTHNVYLTAPDPSLGPDHPFNRQVVSSKGLLADDQIPSASTLREIYDDPTFRRFLASVLGIGQVHPYADPVSSINMHFASEGRELGWHFDNSSFAVTMLVQAPERGGAFQYVPAVRSTADGDLGYSRVAAILDGHEPVRTLAFGPRSLVLFRGRDALHRVTPVGGAVTRMLVVFAFNDEPGVRLSPSALRTFYGRG